MRCLMVLIPDVPAIVLNIPIVLSLVAIIRYVVGFKTWKNYPVLALTLAFYLFYLLLDSTFMALILWSFFTALIVGTAITTRYLIRKLKINYYARVAVMFLGATIFVLLAMALLSQTATGLLISDPLFGIGVFLIATTIDELATLLFKKDKQEFMRRTISTIGAALLSGLLVSWQWWNTFLTGHHEILIAVLLIDVVVAFWTAVRLTELIRFNSIIKNQK